MENEKNRSADKKEEDKKQVKDEKNKDLESSLQLKVLYEDKNLVVIEKPANIKSIPGHILKNTELAKKDDDKTPDTSTNDDEGRQSALGKRKRCDMWEDTIRALGSRSLPAEKEYLKEHLDKLSSKHNIPRKKGKFENFIRRNLKVDDKIIEEIWRMVNECFTEREGEFEDSVVTRLKRNYPEPKLVHRLDQATSGLMVVALDLPTANELSRQFRDREIDKQYIAIVEGLFVSKDNKEEAIIEGEVNIPMRADLDNRPSQIVDEENGKASRTIYKAFKDISREGCSRVELIPFTGRTHQLRVHMAHLGHPMIGDTLYNVPDSKFKSDRLLLHAQSISFTHPATKERISINCEPEF